MSYANIYIHNEGGLFETANAAFKRNPKYKNAKDEINEIWFIFDTEIERANKWNDVLCYIMAMRKFNKYIKVRLLMTTACIEYFFLLHYKKTAPALATPADKKRIEHELKQIVVGYKKGDVEKTNEIAQQYEVAIENGKWSLNRLSYVLNSIEDCDERNEELYKGNHTFTTVHEALVFLKELKTK